MPGEEHRVFWDSCTFISYIERSKSDQALAAMDYFVEKFQNGDLLIVTSVITRVEVLEFNWDAKQIEKFLLFWERPDMVKVAVNIRVAQLAYTIRQHHPRGKLKLDTPDSLQLASALYAEAQEFHTFDGSGENPGLIHLSGKMLPKSKDHPEYEEYNKMVIKTPEIPVVQPTKAEKAKQEKSMQIQMGYPDER